ncbi:hypothetical protein C8Q80DRAFT_1151094 [Daedaleopsis nitida]|nr:hypothetical protein C8Q80DRAFT_1151094 [Daedaleopsis nitida]
MHRQRPTRSTGWRLIRARLIAPVQCDAKPRRLTTPAVRKQQNRMERTLFASGSPHDALQKLPSLYALRHRSIFRHTVLETANCM